MHLFPTLFLALVFVIACRSPALAEKRVALVIGNSDYVLVSPLSNPANDAALMAETLRAVGFEVIETKNANRRDMARSIRDFGKRLRQAGSDAVGLFYYAGHGVQAAGTNYLIPLGAPVEDEADLEIETVSASWVLGQMESAGNALNIVILDACRNNPFRGAFRAATRGLARMNAPSGSLVAYAAAPGQVAADGITNNSPYTAALVVAMEEPGLPLEQVFKRVRIEVETATGENQTPWEESSLKGDFYFIAPHSNITVNVQPEPVPPVQAPPSGFDERQLELSFWETIKDSTRAVDFEAYLKQYTNGLFADLAHIRLDELKEQPTAVLAPPPEPEVAVAELDATFVALRNANLRADPTTASRKVGLLVRDTAVAVTGKVAGKNWYRVASAGQVAYVFGALIAEIDAGELAAWQRIAGSEDVSELEGFLRAYPDGHFAGRAKALLAGLVLPSAPAPGTQAQPAVGVYPQDDKFGETFKDCEECPTMVVIPAGSFMMGSSLNEEWRESNEGPRHRVTIPRRFALGKYEVTFAEWDACVAAGGCDGYRPSDQGWGRGWRPVVNVSWDDATAYLRWLSRQTGYEYRLPSEAEWEYAARAGTTTLYTTGPSISHGQAKYGSGGGTARVGSYPPNAFGLHNVHGNVWEWVEDCWNDDGYLGVPVDGSAWLRGDCGKRVLRGGSWNNESKDIRSAIRVRYFTVVRYFINGFRVARTL